MEKPDKLLFNGEIIPWQLANVHVWTEMPKRGTNVFDAIRAYYEPTQDVYYLLALHDHLKRLLASADTFGFPPIVTFDELRTGIGTLLQALNYRSDVYIRPTLYIHEGGYESDPQHMQLGWYVVAFPLERPIIPIKTYRAYLSPWRKLPAESFPSTIKSGATYALTRLSHIAATQAGYDEAILLNQADHVCETPGASIIVINGKKAKTPQLADGVLDGITRKHLLYLLQMDFDYEISFASIPRTELLQADEVLICGTLIGLARITSVNDKPIRSPNSISEPLLQIYLKHILQNKSYPDTHITVSTFSAQTGFTND